jgi:hypothetical protein
MKKMLMVSNGEHFAARLIKATMVLLIGLALGTAFWAASTPSAQAAGMSPAQMIESHLHGKTLANASKADFLAAVCEAIKKNKSSARGIMQVAVSAHPDWKNDLLKSAFSCAGNDDCRLLGQILHGAIDGSPGSAAGLTDLATALAPGCASAFGGAPVDTEGNFGNPPGINLNPPPGSFGGGGQGNIVAVCVNGQTLFVTPERAQELVNSGQGTLGACQVTPVTNQ